MALQVFRADQHLFEVTTVVVDQVPWFKGKEVAACLGYTNPRKAVRDHVDEEDRKACAELMKKGKELNHQPHEGYINEAGLYSLAMRSKKPQAKAFKRWVTHEVLPSLRKFGAYSTGKVQQACSALLTSDFVTEPEEEARHLYIMKYSFDNTAVKVGRTQDVEKRRQQLQSSHNFVMEVVAFFLDAGHLESAVHTALAPHRSSRGAGREWFALDTHAAIAVVTGIIAASAQGHVEAAICNGAKRRRCTTA